MDQSKWRCPRNVERAKSLKDCWRPTMHVVGIIAWGLFEAYTIMEPDIQMSSSAQCTLLSWALDIAEEMLKQRSLAMPDHLVVQADNTNKETKNSIVCTYGGMLTAAGRLKSVSNHFHRVGHTHGPIDQRFSILGKALQTATVLQTPKDFMEARDTLE